MKKREKSRFDADVALLARIEAHYTKVLRSASPEARDQHIADRYDIPAAARTAYESFIRECGVDKHALVPAWGKLKSFHRARWRTLATDVIRAATRNPA